MKIKDTKWKTIEPERHSNTSQFHKVLLGDSWQVCVRTRASSGTVESETSDAPRVHCFLHRVSIQRKLWNKINEHCNKEPFSADLDLLQTPGWRHRRAQLEKSIKERIFHLHKVHVCYLNSFRERNGGLEWWNCNKLFLNRCKSSISPPVTLFSQFSLATKSFEATQNSAGAVLLHSGAESKAGFCCGTCQ